MPIPLLLVGLGSAAVGVGKTIKASGDQRTAKIYKQSEQDIIEEATRYIKTKKKEANDALMNFGNKKIEVWDGSMKSFSIAYKNLNDKFRLSSISADNIYKFDTGFFREIENMGDIASALLGGAVGGTTIGAITAFGAYGAAMTYGTASTGTAISVLSGAVANNATLAFLGGGTLASGGFGMAGGSMVLGGLVAGPALAIMGFVIGAKASANREKAYSDMQKAKAYKEEMVTAGALCEGIRKRSNMFYRLLIQLDEVFAPLVYFLEQIVDSGVTSYNVLSLGQQKMIADSYALANAVKTVLDTPILTEEGNLTAESEKVAGDVKRFF